MSLNNWIQFQILVVELTLNDALILAGVGSLIGTLTTLLANWLLKRREETVEMSKIKMNSVTEAIPIYGVLAGIYSGLHYESVKRKDTKQKQDKRLLFHHVCDILRLDRIIFYKNGGLILDDLDAEEIINAFGYVLYDTLSKEFDKEGLSKMRKLVKDTEFHEFCDKITKGDDKELYEKFVRWYTTLTNEELTNLENKSKWINEILIFEINSIFSRWYKRKSQFSDLSEELQKYLLETHENDNGLINEPKKQQAIKNYHKKISNTRRFNLYRWMYSRRIHISFKRT
jgi:hypothetical protein